MSKSNNNSSSSKNKKWTEWVERFDGMWRFVLEQKPVNMRALERAQIGFKLGFLLKEFDLPPERMSTNDVVWRQLVKDMYSIVHEQEKRELTAKQLGGFNAKQ